MTQLWLYLGSSTFDSADARSLLAGGALLLDSACRRAANLGGYLIGRDMVAFPDNVPFGNDEALAYANGAARMREFYERYPMKLSARMGCNEPGIKTLAVARLQGAFEAGAGDVCWRMGEDYVGGNWAYGNPELDGDPTHAAIVVEWMRAYRKWSPRSRLIIGYHGYRKAQDDAQALADATWFERRPFDWWKPALVAAGLEWPSVICTEGGYDAGPVADNGYRDRLGSERYARYLKSLPAIAPECTAFCIFIYSGTADWQSFDYSNDVVVKAAIAETNRKETPMSQTIVKTPEQLAHEIWDSAWRWRDLPGAVGYNPDCAIGQYRESNALLGMPLSGEFDRPPPRENELLPAPWPYVCQVFSGGIVLARKGDWKATACGSREQVLRAITSYIAPLA